MNKTICMLLGLLLLPGCWESEEEENGRDGGAVEADSLETPDGDGLEALCDTIEPGYCLIPAGTFLMGSPEDELRSDEDERPLHQVTITRDFLMKATEVTQGEWEEVFGNNPSRFVGCGPDCPVEEVSWWEAVAYANEISARAGLEQCYVMEGCAGASPGARPECWFPDEPCELECEETTFLGLDCEGYRLPTEAEWEYAARAGTTTAFYSGEITGADEEPALEPVAWYYVNCEVDYEGCTDISEMEHGIPTGAPTCAGTNEVGLKEPNAWGLHDVLGNVSEWVGDWYGPYGDAPAVDPLGSDKEVTRRVMRGGSYRASSWACRVGYRTNDYPWSYAGPRGFRLARTPGAVFVVE